VGLVAASVRALLERAPAERRLGPFVLVHQVGHGGFAPVWLAKEVYGGAELRTAAVKLFALDNGRGASTAARERIVEEARALCRVEHPNVVRFYSLPIDDEAGVIGLAMEHVAGTSLDRRMASVRLAVCDTAEDDPDRVLAPGAPLTGPARIERFSLDEALAVGASIASALSAVHRAGLVHRDVKPANIVDAAGVYKLIDFGIAAADVDETTLLGDAPSDGETRRVVQTSGTVGYIDPACLAADAEPAPSSDLYALGATLFELLTGSLPAAVGASAEIGLRGEVLDGRVASPALCAVAPHAPPALGRIVDGLLQADRAARPASAEAVAIALERLRSELAGRAARGLPPEDVGPFRGLERFEERDHDVYFGRASETAASLQTLRARGLLALVGASGTGKSSLARAGVLPAVVTGALDRRRWDAVIASPGSDPRAAICAGLASIVPDARELAPDALVAELAARVEARGAGVVLLVDALEELSLAADESSKAWAVELLARLGSATLPGVRAVVTVRRDLLDPLLSGDLGRAIGRGLVLVEPISELTWADIVHQALDAYGYVLEDKALEEELLRELTGTRAAMPLVQFALRELWRKRDVATKRITRRGYRHIGGILGALERHAEATHATIAAEAHGEEAAKKLLLALTTAQGTRLSRKRAELLAALEPAARRALEVFEAARLVVTEDAGITLAHEALLTHWSRLRSWVDEARSDRLFAEELERDALRWTADPTGAPLWGRRRVADGEALRAHGTSLSAAATAFLDASRRAERRMRRVVGGAVAAVVLAASGGGLAYLQSARDSVRALREEEQRTQRALVQEQMARVEEQKSRKSAEEAQAVAERREREVVDAQAQITELVQRLADPPTKARAIELQDKILRGRAPPERPDPSALAASATPAPSVAALVPPAPSAAQPKPPPFGIKDW
jgi:serine/threonine protein kinase